MLEDQNVKDFWAATAVESEHNLLIVRCLIIIIIIIIIIINCN